MLTAVMTRQRERDWDGGGGDEEVAMTAVRGWCVARGRGGGGGDEVVVTAVVRGTEWWWW
jgi:hypothetical protein